MGRFMKTGFSKGIQLLIILLNTFSKILECKYIAFFPMGEIKGSIFSFFVYSRIQKTRNDATSSNAAAVELVR